MPSCHNSSGLSTGEQCPQSFVAHTDSSCQHKVGGTKDCSGERREQDSDNPHLLLDPAMLSSHSPSQSGTHHIGHIRRGSTLQQGLDDGQVPHEGSHMQGGQAGLWRERGQEPRWGLMALPTSLPAPSLGHAPAQRQTLGPQSGTSTLAGELRGTRRAAASPAVPLPRREQAVGGCCQAQQVLSCKEL